MSNFPYTVVFDSVQNNSLGRCWLAKLEDEYGELYEKALFPVSDYTGVEALERFVEGYVLQYLDTDNDFDAFYVASDKDEDVEKRIREINDYGYSPEYAVEYRDFHDAIHRLLPYFDERVAEEAYRMLANGEDAEEVMDLPEPLEDAFEINYRDVDFDEDFGRWYWTNMQGRKVIIVNVGHDVPDRF